MEKIIEMKTPGLPAVNEFDSLVCLKENMLSEQYFSPKSFVFQ